MSAQNNLKKPTFSKGVMGYTPAEVDRYIDHVNERYNTVSREAAELKRKVINLQLRLDEAEERTAEAEKQLLTTKIFDKGAISQVFDMLERENSRHAQFIDLLKDKLCDMLDDEVEENDDGDWEEALDSFIDAPDLTSYEEDADAPEAEAEVEIEAEVEAEPEIEIEAETEAELEVGCSVAEEDDFVADVLPFIGGDEYTEIADITAVADIFDGGDDEVEEVEEAEAFDASMYVYEPVAEPEPVKAVEADPAPMEEKPYEAPFEAVFASYDDEDGSAKTMELPRITRTSIDLDIEAETPDHKHFEDPKTEEIWSELDEIFSKVKTGTSMESDNAPAEPALAAEDSIDMTCGEAEDSETDSDDKKSKTPAESLAELDFYQDHVHQDGESFDPMTLAAEVTTKRSKTTYEDFFKNLSAENKKK